jgi:hypothetical protein
MKSIAILIFLVLASVIYAFAPEHPFLYALQLLLIAFSAVIWGKSKLRQKISFWITVVAFTLLLITIWL